MYVQLHTCTVHTYTYVLYIYKYTSVRMYRTCVHAQYKLMYIHTYVQYVSTEPDYKHQLTGRIHDTGGYNEVGGVYTYVCTYNHFHHGLSIRHWTICPDCLESPIPPVHHVQRRKQFGTPVKSLTTVFPNCY